MSDHIHVRIESNAIDSDHAQVRSLTARERISQLFEIEIHLACTSAGAVDGDKLMTEMACVVFEQRAERSKPGKELRRIYCVVRSVRDRLLSHSSHGEYVLELVPRAWQCTLSRKHDIYQQMSIPQIIKRKLEEGAALQSGKDVELRLDGAYDEREFVVQYGESDLNFLQRWAEHLGIFYFFDHGEGRDRIVFGDANAQFAKLDPPQLSFTGRGERTGIHQLESCKRMVTTAFRARDYNYRNPSMDVGGEAKSSCLGAGLANEFGVHVKTPAEANHLAAVRAEEAAATHLIYSAASATPQISAGHVVTIEGHARGDIELLITEVEHRVVQPAVGFGDDEVQEYENHFQAIAKDTPYRPPRLTPKPVVAGTVTGIVQAEASTKFGAIDDQGRYRVSFMYDSVADRDEGKASRSVRMAQPSAGSDRGLHMPLKAGTEVLLTCVNGDPDRPIIAGAVPNPQTGSPVTSANAEKTTIKTNVNRIEIDDDKPRCKISVDGTAHVIQVGEPNADEQGIFSGTTANMTSAANGTFTNLSAAATTFADWKLSTVIEDIVAFAGEPNPLSFWQKAALGAKAAAALVKGVFAPVDAVQKQAAIQSAKDKKRADDNAAEAKAKHDKLQQDLVNGLGHKYPNDAETVTRADGTSRRETKAEFNSRVLKAAQGDADAKKQSTKPVPTLKTDHAVMLKKAAERAEHKAKTASDVDAKAKAEAKGWGDTWKQVSGSTKGAVDAATALTSAITGGSALYSKISKAWGKASLNAKYVELKVNQRLTTGYAFDSGQRSVAKCGSFGKHCNIQGATDSTGLLGRKNVFISGSETTVMSADRVAAVFGLDEVHVKSQKCAELASKKVQLSSKQLLDVDSRKDIKVVAKESFELTTEDKSIKATANKESIELLALQKDIYLDAKNKAVLAHGKDKAAMAAGGGSGFGMVAFGETLHLGKVSGVGDMASVSKDDKCALQFTDKEVIVCLDSSELELSKKGITWKAGGTSLVLEKSADTKIKAKGKFIAKGNKVMLG